jgi:hypothetical protein
MPCLNLAHRIQTKPSLLKLHAKCLSQMPIRVKLSILLTIVLPWLVRRMCPFQVAHSVNPCQTDSTGTFQPNMYITAYAKSELSLAFQMAVPSFVCRLHIITFSAFSIQFLQFIFSHITRICNGQIHVVGAFSTCSMWGHSPNYCLEIKGYCLHQNTIKNQLSSNTSSSLVESVSIYLGPSYNACDKSLLHLHPECILIHMNDTQLFNNMSWNHLCSYHMHVMCSIYSLNQGMSYLVQAVLREKCLV